MSRESVNPNKLFKEQQEVWKPVSTIVSVHQTISVLSLVYWIYLIVQYYSALMKPNSVESSASLHGFFPYFAVIVFYPVLYFMKQIIRTIYESGLRESSDPDPYYSICIGGQTSLTEKELAIGAVGKVDYACLKKQTKFVESMAEMIVDRSYYLIYSIFAFTLFLFASDAGSFRNKLSSRNSIFLNNLIRQALVLSLITMSSALFTEYYYLSTIIMLIYKNILQMIGATLSLVVCFILYRLIYLYI
jgi:hypothetical protein